MSNKISQYIAGFPSETQTKLESLRACIQENAPEAEECMNYGIPTFKYFGNLVHFAGYKSHIGFYPGATGIAEFQKDLNGYHFAKGSVQFPLMTDLPLKLIGKIVRFRVKQNKLVFEKKNKKTCKHGHVYIKSSTCPTCPKCEALKAQKYRLVPGLSAPAQRALQAHQVNDLEALSAYSENDLLLWHGLGKSSLPKIKAALKAASLKLKD